MTILDETIKAHETMLGWRHQNPRFLDNLGIYFDMKTLQTFPILIYFRNKYYGRGRIGRFWCHRIRPIIAPKSHRNAKELYAIAHKLFERDTLEKTMAMAEKIMGEEE